MVSFLRNHEKWVGVRVEVQGFIGFLNQYRNKDQHLVSLFTICKDFYFFRI